MKIKKEYIFMDERQSQTREISVLDVFKSLKKKLRLVAIITLIALILGAAGGAAITILSNATYGTEAQFYIYSEESNSYILSLLRSDRFAERLLLDSNGLPASDVGSDAYNAVLELQKQVDEKEDEIIKKQEDLNKYPDELSTALKASQDAQSRYNEAFEQLALYQDPKAENTSNAIVPILQEKLNNAEKARNEAETKYSELLADNQAKKRELESLEKDLDSLKDKTEKKRDEALAGFRANKDNLLEIEKIKKSVTFNYASDANDKESESKALLKVNIAVKFDKAFAEKLLTGINTNLPSFVEDSVTAKEGERETECVFISVFGAADSVNYQNPVINAVKYALIAAVAAFALTAFGVVIADIFFKAPKEETKDSTLEQTQQK